MIDVGQKIRNSRYWRGLVIAVVVAASLSACGEDSPITVPSPTGSFTRTGLTSLPTSLPSRTRTTEPDATLESSTTRETTSEPTSEETSEETTSGPTSEPTTATVTRETEVTATSSPTPTDDATDAGKKGKDKKAEGDGEDDGTPPWIWWLLAALAVAGAVLALLLPRALRRRRWDAELASSVTEARWLAGELLPQLQQASSVAEVAGGWQVSAGRVAALEDQLTGLVSSAPDEPRRGRATELRDAVRAARGEVDRLITSGTSPSPSRELSAIASRLAAALDPATPPN